MKNKLPVYKKQKHHLCILGFLVWNRVVLQYTRSLQTFIAKDHFVKNSEGSVY